MGFSFYNGNYENFWDDTSNAPDLTNLNTGAGVVVDSSSGGNLKQMTINSNGLNYSWTDATRTWLFQMLVGAVQWLINFGGGETGKLQFSEVAGDLQITKEVEEIATGNKGAVVVDKNKVVIRSIQSPGGGDDMEAIINNDGTFILQGNVTQVFKVDFTGQIQTNQGVAPGAHATLNAEIEVFDMAGVSLGFIPVFTV